MSDSINARELFEEIVKEIDQEYDETKIHSRGLIYSDPSWNIGLRWDFEDPGVEGSDFYLVVKSRIWADFLSGNYPGLQKFEFYSHESNRKFIDIIWQHPECLNSLKRFWEAYKCSK